MFLTTAPAFAQLTNYQDPSGYPTLWPDSSGLGWKVYTRLGAAQSDLTGGVGGDQSTGGTTPQSSADFSSGPSNTEPSILFNIANNILFFRLRVNGPPFGSGASEPYASVSWGIFLDTDGDGYKEWVIQVDGDDGVSIEPDDIVIAYNNNNSQAWAISDAAWRQDSADSNNVDGPAFSSNPNGLTAWDRNPDAYIWDFGRTRIVQIDRTKNAQSNLSEYFIDIQAPLSAFVKGANTLSGKNFTIAAATGNSNANPLQKDLLSGGDALTVAADGSSVIPGGDITDLNGTVFQAPIITGLTNTLNCPIDTITVEVLDALTVSGGLVVDTIDSVKLEYYLDYDNDGVANDAGFSWTTLGTATRVSGAVGKWRFNWNLSTFSFNNFLIRAIVKDQQGNTTISTNQSSNQTTSVFNTCSTLPAYNASTKTIQDNPDTVVAGAQLNYILTIRNTGTASDTGTVTVLDTLDSDLTFVQFLDTAGDTLTIGDGRVRVRYTIPGLSVFGIVTRTFKVQIKNTISKNVITNKGWISSTHSGVQTVCVSVSVNVLALPNITLSKTVDKANAAPGDTLLYTMTYLNAGFGNATLLVITDGSPSNTTYITNSVNVNGAPKGDAAEDGDNVIVMSNGPGHDITVNIGTVIPGGSGTITFKTVVN